MQTHIFTIISNSTQDEMRSAIEKLANGEGFFPVHLVDLSFEAQNEQTIATVELKMETLAFASMFFQNLEKQLDIIEVD